MGVAPHNPQEFLRDDLQLQPCLRITELSQHVEPVREQRGRSGRDRVLLALTLPSVTRTSQPRRQLVLSD